MLAKFKLITIEALISKALIDSVINPDKFVLINNVLKEYEKMKRKNQKSKELNSSSKILVHLERNFIV